MLRSHCVFHVEYEYVIVDSFRWRGAGQWSWGGFPLRLNEADLLADFEARIEGPSGDG